MNIPQRLVYKYVTAERIDVLKDCRIRFTQPDALNDPFEFLPCLDQYKAAVLERLRHTRVNKFGEEMAKLSDALTHDMVSATLDDFPKIMSHLFAFLSVSQIPDHPLMWSHYADSHKGFVIGFDAENTFFAPGNLSLQGLSEVQYSRDRYVLPINGLDGMAEAELAAANVKLVFTKSIDWEYEREMRLIAMPNHADRVLEPANQPKIYLLEFPSEAVQEVIFGFRMSNDMKAEVAGLLEEKYPHAALRQAQISRDKYALDIVPYRQFVKSDERLAVARKLFGWQIVYK